MRRRLSAPVLRFGMPPDAPAVCGRCGWAFDWFSRWHEHRTVSGLVVARVHRICPPRAPASGYLGYGREVSGA